MTRVGRTLRRYSLDELPQLWNVLKGEMSLVGPRPIVDAEVPKYRDAFDLYTMVRPGMTGYWQISGKVRHRLRSARRARRLLRAQLVGVARYRRAHQDGVGGAQARRRVLTRRTPRTPGRGKPVGDRGAK